MGNATLTLTALVVALLALFGLGVVIPEWLRERMRGAQTTDRLEECRRQLAQAQAQLETTRQALIRCREQVIARNLDDIKSHDPVEVANDIIRNGKRGGDAP